MALINRILNALILVLALVALVFGVMLYQKRQNLRAHSDELAQGVEKIVKRLAPGSELAKRATYDDGKGNLGFDNVENLNTITADIEKHAEAVVAQRDTLGQTVASLANEFDMMAEPVQPETLVNLDTYAEKTQEISASVEAVKARNLAMAAKLTELGRDLGVEVQAAELVSTDPAVYNAALNRLGDKLNELNQINDQYSTAITTVVDKLGAERMEVQASQFKDPKQAEQALTTFANNLEKIRTSLDSVDVMEGRIDSLETERDRLADSLGISKENVIRLTNRVEQLELQNADLLTQKPDNTAPVESQPRTEILEGRIVDVNYDWGYVVINIGQSDNLTNNISMTVGRDREYIGNVLVTKVFNDYAVAEIVPEMQQGMVLEGDNVYWLGEEAALSTPPVGGSVTPRPDEENGMLSAPPTEGDEPSEDTGTGGSAPINLDFGF